MPAVGREALNGSMFELRSPVKPEYQILNSGDFQTVAEWPSFFSQSFDVLEFSSLRSAGFRPTGKSPEWGDLTNIKAGIATGEGHSRGRDTLPVSVLVYCLMSPDGNTNGAVTSER